MTAATATSEAARAPGPRLTVLAQARWPERSGDSLPPIPGFIVSSFSPLVAEVARRCLARHFGTPPAEAGRGERTAVVIASNTGDLATAAAVARAVDEGRRVPALLFFQSNHNAVAGHIAARWGLAGPVLCTVGAADALADARASAELLIEDGDADAALVVVADQGSAGSGQGGDGSGQGGAGRDQAVALLIGPESWLPAGTAPGRADHANEWGD